MAALWRSGALWRGTQTWAGVPLEVPTVRAIVRSSTAPQALVAATAHAPRSLVTSGTAARTIVGGGVS